MTGSNLTFNVLEEDLVDVLKGENGLDDASDGTVGDGLEDDGFEFFTADSGLKRVLELGVEAGAESVHLGRKGVYVWLNGQDDDHSSWIVVATDEQEIRDRIRSVMLKVRVTRGDRR